jgi:hypothetical protein
VREVVGSRAAGRSRRPLCRTQGSEAKRQIGLSVGRWTENGLPDRAREVTQISRKVLSGVVGREAGAGRLNRKTYMTVTAALFLVMAIMHLLRIIFGWHVEIAGLSIPFWVSWVGVLWPVPSHTSASNSTVSPTGSPTCRDEPLDRALALGR